MFARLYELSKLLLADDRRAAWELLNEGIPPVYDRGIAVCFDSSGRFDRVRRYDNKEGIAYRKGPSQGTDLTPCCMLTTPPKTVNRLARAVDALAAFTEDPSLSVWLEAVSAALEGQRDEIVAAVEETVAASGLALDHRGYLFAARLADGEIAPLFRLPDARAHLVAEAMRRFDDGTAAEGTCCLCGESGRRVFGNFSVLKCYNLDKPGTIAGGFDRGQGAARNFPVCESCAVPVSLAIQHAREHLSTSAAGVPYLALPAARTEKGTRYLLKRARAQPEILRLPKQRDLLAAGVPGENDLLETVAEMAADGIVEHLGFSLVFFASSNAEWRIQAEVPYVAPGRAAELWDAARDLRDDPMLTTSRRHKGGIEVRPFLLDTRTLKDFARGAASDLRASERVLRAWLAALFEKRTVDRRDFLHRVLSVVLATWRRTPNLGPFHTRQAWGVYRYALATGLIQGDRLMDPHVPDSPYGKYCATHAAFFTRQPLVASFLAGCFASVVTSVQRRERGAAPFARKFQGRKVDGVFLHRLYGEGRDKLAAYGALGIVVKSRLDADLAEAFVACGDRWDASADETTFAFTLGLSLQFRIAQAAGLVGDGQRDEDRPD